MIRMIQSQNAAAAKEYFKKALSQSDYYLSDQEQPGFWQGELATRLGLEGRTDKKQFERLCDNVNPKTGENLTPMNAENRTVGYDINFHCPKSVSIMHAMSNDDHILNAFRDSVTEIMKDIERDVLTRVRIDGAQDDRAGEGLVWGHFVHQTARPVEGLPPDPHLHSHCYVFNATFDPVEQRIKAAQFRDIKRDMPYYEACFHKRLADRLTDLGYGIDKTEKFFEIAHVPQKAIDLFSKRTDEIGRVAKERGITDAKELDALGAKTRAAKDAGLTMDQLKEQWKTQMEALPRDAEDGLFVRHVMNRIVPHRTPEQCLNHAVLHCFERASVIDGRRLQEQAIRNSLGTTASLEDIKQAFVQDKRIIAVESTPTRTQCSTKEVLAEERRMVGLAREGFGAIMPLYDQLPEIKLDGQQRQAVEHVLSTGNRVSIIRGAAGAGKTTLMHEAVKHMENAGKEVTIIAPSSQASRGVLKEQEKFEQADTVARFLLDKDMQDKARGNVIWVDEAGLLGVTRMTALLQTAKRLDARLILGGDTRQHASVERGDALRILNTVGGVKVAEVNKIYRTKNEQYKSAVMDLSKGDVDRAFQKIDRLGWIKDIDVEKPYDAITADYVESVKRGRDALVISPTHAQGEALTQAIREKLRDDGRLGKKDVPVNQYKKLGLTEAQKADRRHYKDGQIVQFTQNARGYKRGSHWTVERREDDIWLRAETGEPKRLPTDQADRFEVYRQKSINLAKDDKVMITDNKFDNKGKRMNNGDMFRVTGFTKDGEVKLKKKWGWRTFIINKDFSHLDHAHCITSHASQGKTVDEVFIFQPTATFTATNAKQFYVSFSRAKNQAKIYTDDKKELLDHARQLGERLSASELVKSVERQHEYIARNVIREQELEKQQQKERDYGLDK